MRTRDIAATSATVAAEHEAARRAFAERDVAETLVLDRMVEAARPALPAIASRLQVGWTLRTGVAQQDFHPTLRGTLVAGDAKPQRDFPRRASGAFEGDGLHLLEDGTFLSLEYDGHWTEGGSEHWEAKATPMTFEEVVAEHDARAIAERIAAALERAVGSRDSSVANAEAMARKFRAVAELLAK